MLVVWVQNDNNKRILQAAESVKVPLLKDAGLTGCTTEMSCGPGNISDTHTVTLKNTGSATITTARINYKIDTNTYQTYTWTGSLTAGASTPVVLPIINNITAGYHVLTDSIISFNGDTDVNTANNKITTPLLAYDNTPVLFPLLESFDLSNNVPNNWLLFDENLDAKNWVVSNGGRNSNYALKFNGFKFGAGEISYAILPTTNLPAGARSLDFWMAHAQYYVQYAERLEVIYSTDCGDNWTSLWSRSGTALATRAPSTTEYTPVTADYRLRSVDLSVVPSGALIAFKATSANGNNIYIDDVNIRPGIPTGVEHIIAASNLKLYPNPAGNTSVLEFTLPAKSRVLVMLYDMTGRLVHTVVNASLGKGNHRYALNTLGLSSGLYNVKIQTESGSITEPLSVIR